MGWAGLAAGTPAQDSRLGEERTHYPTWPSSSDVGLFEKSHRQYYLEIYCGGDKPGHLLPWAESMGLIPFYHFPLSKHLWD